MNLRQSFGLALDNIWGSKVRSILTMLGIIIGVAAVIVIVGLGTGMEHYMTDSFQSMGTNLLTVNVFGRGSSRSASVDDMYEIADENPTLFNGMSPTLNLNGPVKIGTETTSYTSITGVSEDYADMNRLSLSDGRFLQYIDMSTRNKTCVVGSFIAKEYYGGNAVGETIRIGGVTYTIVGVLEEKAESSEGDSDDVIYVPYTTAMKTTGQSVSSYSFAMVSEEYVAEAKAAIETSLIAIFGSDSAFYIMSLSELLDEMSSMINIMVTILAAIAAISLVVGGVGIMNIMLVSVSERTREIGIRKALGAKRRHIMWQFVIEAGTTSALGGVIGILAGYGFAAVGTSVISMALGEPLAISPSALSALTAFLISAGIGILFGYLPAKKAAKLNPIDALRYE